MEGLDVSHTQRVKRRNICQEIKQQQAANAEAHCSKSTKAAAKEAATSLGQLDDMDDELTDQISQDPDASISKWQSTKMKQKSETVTLELPRKGLAKALSPSAGRMQLSTRQSFAYAADIIRLCKRKVNDFAMSRSTFYEQRKTAEKELAGKLISKFLNDPQVKYCIIHWDGKIVKYMDNTVEDRIVLLLQAIAGDVPPQFIGAPRVPNGTGATMKYAMIEYLTKYGIKNENKLLVWDLTLVCWI
jgi:hypothetical protein